MLKRSEFDNSYSGYSDYAETDLHTRLTVIKQFHFYVFERFC